MKTAIVVGAGISGLSCALELEKNGYQVQILEKENHPGGRVHSDIVDGYILNCGFQVLQTGYPETKKLLDYKKLELCNLELTLIHFSEPTRTERLSYAVI